MTTRQETATEFEQRVSEIALKSGIKIKEFSTAWAAKHARGENDNTTTISDDAIAQTMVALAHARPDQVTLLRPLARLSPPRVTATERLEKANAAAVKTTKPQRTLLSDEQKKWIAKYGAEAALEAANEATHAKAIKS